MDFHLLDAGRLYGRKLEARLRNLSLELTQCRALVALAENPGVTQRRLAQLISIDPAALGRILDRLEALGLAQRRPRSGDRRARSLMITQQAKRLLPLIGRVSKESQLAALAGLSRAEARMLVRALERVLVNLKAPGAVGARTTTRPQDSA